MSRLNIRIRKSDLEALRRAFNNSPDTMKKHSDRLITKIDRETKKIMFRNPWEIGGSGGGVPVDTKYLRQSHQSRRSPYEMKIWVPGSHPYASYVHEGTRKMEARPWMDYAADKVEGSIDGEIRTFLDSVVSDLSK